MKNLFTSQPAVHKAFTLIELLVVIAIIAILAAILFPVFGRARENARRSSCQSNMKQIGLGILQYVQDYDETYPMSNKNTTTYTESGGGTGLWMVNTYPYVKSTQIYACPSGAKGISAKYDGASGGTLDFPLKNQLGANEWVILPNLSTTTVKISQIPQASLLGMIADSTLASWNNPWRVINANGVPYSEPTGIDPSFARHFDGTNILYADGHVKYQDNRRITKGQVTTTTGDPDHTWGLVFKLNDPRLQ
jgi:prepilin-type N-terminal cleavage/methylation domain-containing protein/prepilin-type processing-associated H-X9-DG protein